MCARIRFTVVRTTLMLLAIGWTAARVFAAEPWRVVAVGDSRGDYNGVNTPILTELASRIVAEDPDVVLFPGDLVNGAGETATLTSQLTTWRTIMQPVYDAGIVVLAVRGNHENSGPVAGWNNVFTGAYAMPNNGPMGEVNITFSLTHKTAFFIGLDQYSGHDHRVNQAWLDAQLAANTKPHVFVMGHEPAYKANHADCLDDYPTNRNTFWASVAAAGGRTYFCGHDHFYNHARIDDGDGNPNDDLHQLIVGTGGAPFHTSYAFDGINSGMVPLMQYFAVAYGYVVIDIDGLDVTLTWKQRVAANNYPALEAWSYTVPPNVGDTNCDGVVDFDDINPFVAALVDREGYESQYPGCPWLTGDIDGSETVDFDDINPFVACLVAGECP
jgi:hypothetical protein